MLGISADWNMAEGPEHTGMEVARPVLTEQHSYIVVFGWKQ